jgi:hypothetical protein
MKKYIFITTALAIGLCATDQPQTFSGVITDTMCGKTHGMLPGQPDDKCIAACLKGSSSEYALNTGTEILKLSDQKKAAPFAARRVKVSGTLNAKNHTIKVNSIESEGGAQ